MTLSGYVKLDSYNVPKIDKTTGQQGNKIINHNLFFYCPCCWF